MELIQQLINGITLGSTYALIALGYTMVYGIVLLINFAHGEIFMFGAFAGLFIVTYLGLTNLYLAILGAMVFSMGLGVIIEFIAYRPLRGSTRLSALISAIGVSIFLGSLMVLIRGANVTSFPRKELFTMKNIEFFGLSISNLQVAIILIAAILMISLQLFVNYTKIGRAMRATSMDGDASILMGVNQNAIISITFAIGSGLAAAGGVLWGLNFSSIHPYMGLMAGLKAFAAAVLGGIGSIPGAMFGGVFLGVAETLGIASGLSKFKDAFAFTILILVLLLRPTGLFGRKISKKV